MGLGTSTQHKKRRVSNRGTTPSFLEKAWFQAWLLVVCTGTGINPVSFVRSQEVVHILEGKNVLGKMQSSALIC